jgi:uncharacterized membrane protein YeaQ/YmgE (transglycosylase-associated protein family)
MSDIVLWLIIGMLAGGLASLVLPTRSPDGVLQSIIIGTLGGVFGGFVLDALDAEETMIWLGALGVAVLGAVVLLHLMRSVDRTTRI